MLASKLALLLVRVRVRVRVRERVQVRVQAPVVRVPVPGGAEPAVQPLLVQQVSERQVLMQHLPLVLVQTASGARTWRPSSQ